MSFFVSRNNTRSYTLSFGHRIKHLLAVFALKQKHFEQIFVLIQANTALKQQMTKTKLGTSQILLTSLILYIFILVQYLDSTVINSQIKYCLATKRRNFLQMAFSMHIHINGLSLKPKT